MTSILLPVHHLQQRHSGDCLAASAAMVLAYMGISVRYKRLLKLLEIQWFGTPSFSVLNELKIAPASLLALFLFVVINSYQLHAQERFAKLADFHSSISPSAANSAITSSQG